MLISDISYYWLRFNLLKGQRFRRFNLIELNMLLILKASQCKLCSMCPLSIVHSAVQSIICIQTVFLSLFIYLCNRYICLCSLCIPDCILFTKKKKICLMYHIIRYSHKNCHRSISFDWFKLSKNVLDTNHTSSTHTNFNHCIFTVMDIFGSSE